MATHDVEFAEAHASRCALLFMGEIAADEPAETFSGTTSLCIAAAPACRRGGKREATAGGDRWKRGPEPARGRHRAG